MNTVTIVLLVIAVILVAAVIALYFLGKRAEKKQAEQQEMMAANSQTINLFVIDKKKMKLKEAGLPKIVEEQTPKYMRRFKLPVIKAKAGPRVMTFICDDKVYPQILPKQEIKATVSGIYITGTKRIRGPIYEAPQKQSFFSKIFKRNS